jgi:hypothetical protein
VVLPCAWFLPKFGKGLSGPARCLETLFFCQEVC